MFFWFFVIIANFISHAFNFDIMLKYKLSLNYLEEIEPSTFVSIHKCVSNSEKTKISIKNNKIIIIQDARNSVPVYYATKENKLLISDKINFFVKNFDINHVKLEEYIHFGFVLGKNTFLEKVYQVLPNEKIFINLVSGQLKKEQKPIFRRENCKKLNLR